MRRAIIWASIVAGVAVVSHLGVVVASAQVLMAGAMARISRDGAAINTWTHAPRTTEASRNIVRPSPDLAYSSCVYDLSKGPVLATAAGWDTYYSLSVYQANSDNIFVIDDRAAPDGVEIILFKQGSPRPATVGKAILVESPTDRGIVLQRRLAPTAESFAAAAVARRNDRCELLAASQR